MSLHLVPGPPPPMAVRIFDLLLAHGPMDVTGIDALLVRSHGVTDGNWIISAMLEGLCRYGWVTYDGERYRAVAQ